MSRTIPSTPSPPKNESENNDPNKIIQSESGVYYAQVVEKDYAWKEEQENILKKWADKALCFKMMHEKAYKRYWCLNAWFNIPIIIISTITGTGNFASGNFITGTSYFIFALGTLNLFGGILATIATYTGVAQKLEAHRFASINWDKFIRKIQIELAKSRKDRVKARDFIRQSAEEYDRLIEMSPILPNDIVSWFTKLIKTDNDVSLNGPCSCCYDWFCFACGCNINCCFPNKENKSTTDNLKSEWDKIEVPEIVGRIRPTQIAPVVAQYQQAISQPKYVAIRPSSSENMNSLNPEESLSRSISNYGLRRNSTVDKNKRSTVSFEQPSTQMSFKNMTQPFVQEQKPSYSPSSQFSAQPQFTSQQQYTSQPQFNTQLQSTSQLQFSAQPQSISQTQFSVQPQSISQTQFSAQPQLDSPIRVSEIEMKNMSKQNVALDNSQINLHNAFESERTSINDSKSLLVKVNQLSDSSIDFNSDTNSEHTDYTI